MPSRRTSAGARSDAAALRLAQIAAGVAGPSRAPGPEPLPEAAVPEAVVSDDWWADHTRIAPAVRERPAPDPAPPAVVPAIPVPGRHAARRRLLPDLRHVAGALPALAPAHLAVVALVVALGLAVTTWWVVRADPGPATAPVAAEPASPLVGGPASDQPGTGSAPDAATSGAGTATEGASPAGSVTVDVAGKVRRPGIVVLRPGARVTDALHAAGGPRPGVDLTSLNLARVLVDGEQIVVGAPAAARPAGPVPGSAAPGAPAAPPAGALVDLNHAGQAELESLPQVGPVTAQAIIAWREQRGGFTSVEELLEVEGIGEKTLARLTPYVTV